MALSPLVVYDPHEMARRRKPANQTPAEPGTLAHLIQTLRDERNWTQFDVAMRARESEGGR